MHFVQPTRTFPFELRRPNWRIWMIWIRQEMEKGMLGYSAASKIDCRLDSIGAAFLSRPLYPSNSLFPGPSNISQFSIRSAIIKFASICSLYKFDWLFFCNCISLLPIWMVLLFTVRMMATRLVFHVNALPSCTQCKRRAFFFLSLLLQNVAVIWWFHCDQQPLKMRWKLHTLCADDDGDDDDDTHNSRACLICISIRFCILCCWWGRQRRPRPRS